LENVGNAITPLPIDQFERNLGDRIPSYPQHVRHDAVAMVTAVAMLTALAMNILVLWGADRVEIEHMHNFDETSVCLCMDI